MNLNFAAHNILLDDGAETRPENDGLTSDSPWFKATKRAIELVYPGEKSAVSIVDLGCLEGGFAVGFARMGLDTLGIDVRQSNIEICNYVKTKVHLSNLRFVRDDAWRVGEHGSFDIVFCCGLLYHIDRPREFIEVLSKASRKVLILQTHYATELPNRKFGLSGRLEQNEGATGRWYTEYNTEKAFKAREEHRESSWDNRRSFWLTKEWILQSLYDCGYDMVFEQFDALGENIVESMTKGEYIINSRSTFVGIRMGVK